MGIVFRQSLNNTIITYLGFGIGGINALFLYTRFLGDEYYGLVGVILSTSAILMPILAFGVPNALVKFYSSFKNAADSNSFLTLMLVLPLFLLLPIGAISYLANNTIGEFLARENAIVKDYIWYIFLIGAAMAYFEIFYSWSKVQLKSVFGTFMKEVFVRLGVTVLLLLVYMEVISISLFLKLLVGLYIFRTLIMKLYAYRLRFPVLNFKFPSNINEILGYSALIILGASASVILLEIDRFMINQFIAIENVAYYSVAIWIATVVVVPSRAMHQITYPLTAELLNNGDNRGLHQLYKKSSLTLFIISGLIFILVILNLEDLYQLLPQAYGKGFTVVLLIGLAKVYDSLLGNNNSILYSSKYYGAVLVFGALLAVVTILLNLWLIPVFGLEGAALATFFAIVLYNSTKLIYVHLKFGILPFSAETLKVLGLLLVVGAIFYLLSFPFHPIVNIFLKSILIIAMYMGILYRFKISEDVLGILNKYFKK